MKIRIASQGGDWTAEAEVLSKEGDDDGRAREEDWIALAPLRRPRAAGAQALTRVLPRTWAALVRFEQLALELPAPAGERAILEVELDNDAPATPCVLDTPSASTDDDFALDAVAGSIALDVPAAANQVPGWIDRVRLRQIRANGQTTTTTTTFAQVLATYFGAAASSAEQVTFDASGLRFVAARAVPWEAGAPKRGRFRAIVDRSAGAGAPQWSLALESAPDWIASLRRFQAAAVTASARRREPGELPSPDGPSVGLVPGELPDELTWRRRGAAWVFDPGRLFAVELRGVGDGAALWASGELAIELVIGGVQVTAVSAEPPAGAPVRYVFERAAHTNLWSADLEPVPVADSLAGALDRLGDGTAPARRAWVMTETGALALPFDPPGPRTAAEAPAPSVLAGAITLCEVPWAEEPAAEGAPPPPPFPDLAAVDGGRLFVLAAGAARAQLRFSPAGTAIALDRVDLALDRVHVRAEECLALYAPPAPAASGPPALPGLDEPASFVDLPLDHRTGTGTGAGTVPGATRLRMRVEFRPGRSAERREGAWLARDLELRFAAGDDRAAYWFRPAGLRWIPALPWGGDPRAQPAARITARRTYLPVQPRTAAQPVVLGRGAAWYLPVLASGTFGAFPLASSIAAGELPRPFAWATPDLPGMSFALIPDHPIEVRAGRLHGGSLEWALRAGLPLLDELHALRVLDSGPAAPAPAPALDEDAPAPALDDAAWWARLLDLVALAQARRDRLFAEDVAIQPGAVIREDRAVGVRNLYAAQVLPGIASIDAAAGTASLALRAADGTPVAVMPPDRLLEGPTGRFEIAARPAGGSPVLAPSASPDAPIELRAGSIAPHLLDGVALDQSGRTSAPPAGPGRSVAIPPGEPTATAAAPAGALEPYFQWTSRAIDLASPGVQLAWHAVALPVGREGGRWVFAPGQRGDLDDVLRDYRWATLGPVRLFGLAFQPLRLDRVAFPASAAWPDEPDEVVVSGVLHARPGAIRVADAISQLATLAFRRTGAAWSLEAVHGRVVWPLHEPAPDGADAIRADLADPLPWIEAAIELVQTSQGPALRFGRPGEPPRLVFRCFERSWTAALERIGGDLGADGAGEVLQWRVLPGPTAPRSELRITGGEVALDRRVLPEASTVIELEATAGPTGAPPLVDLDLALTLAPRTPPAPALRRARFLATSATAQLVEIDRAAVTIRAGRLAIAAGAPPGFRDPSAPFELLPGWPVDTAVPLHAYVTLALEPPPATGRTAAAAIADARLAIETAVRAPGRIDTTISLAIIGGAAPRYQLGLTGQLAATSDISWPSPDGGARWVHDVAFTLHQAIVPGERLQSGARSFFAPRPLTAAQDPAGLGGMIEVPCLATHRLREETGARTIATWTAAQRLRIGAPESFAQEISLRGARRVEELAIKRRANDIRLEYRAATDVEQGFAGPLGQQLHDVWRDQATMVLEATEAFWLRLAPGAAQGRDPAALWRRDVAGVGCVPSQLADFTVEPADWVRVPVPFVTDSRGLARAARAANPAGELARLLGNVPRRTPSPPGNHDPVPLPRDALLHRRDLDRLALHAAPPRVPADEAIDPVLLTPDAHDRWLPYLRAWSGFEPGWLIFTQWRPGTAPADYAVPFAATAEVLARLPAPAGAPDRLCVAATEVVPAGDPRRPRLIPSPALELRAIDAAAAAGDGVRLLVELWHPGAGTGLALLGRAVFSFAVPAGATWADLLFGDPGADPLRAALPRWIDAHRARIPAGITALVRARALGPVPQLAEPAAYLLLDRDREDPPALRARRDRLAPTAPVTADPRLEVRAGPLVEDPLARGPDLVAARVFYATHADPRPPGEPAVAGTAVGFAHKLAGTAPGPHHRSRLPRSHPGAGDRRWIETVRDLVFADRTRRDLATRGEPGWLLPAARPLPALDAAHAGDAAHTAAAAILPAQVAHLFTAGRPGELMRVRVSLLTEGDGLVRRSASLAHELRFPRPAPLPPSLVPFHPGAPGRTALVELPPPRPPFRFAKLAWQDPIYNRRLLAVPQQIEGDGLVLVLDRSVVGGVDVLYPELRWSPPAGTTAWSIAASLRVARAFAGRLSTIAQLAWTIDPGGVAVTDGRGTRPVAAREGQALRWVLELGLAQPAPADFDGALELAPHNRDQLIAEATVRWTANGVARTRTIALRAQIRTDVQVWPQPQAAYGILRARDGGPQELVGFGWLPRPAIVRRRDRFVPESWEATFRHVDTWLEPGALAGAPAEPAPVAYEVATYTAYGEQLSGQEPLR